MRLRSAPLRKAATCFSRKQMADRPRRVAVPLLSTWTFPDETGPLVFTEGHPDDGPNEVERNPGEERCESSDGHGKP